VTTPHNSPNPRTERFRVLCCDRYTADLRDQYAFTFQVLDTGTRYTVYTADGDRFHVAATDTGCCSPTPARWRCR
jgi:hypothetical protein